MNVSIPKYPVFLEDTKHNSETVPPFSLCTPLTQCTEGVDVFSEQTTRIVHISFRPVLRTKRIATLGTGKLDKVIDGILVDPDFVVRRHGNVILQRFLQHRRVVASLTHLRHFLSIVKNLVRASTPH